MKTERIIIQKTKLEEMSDESINVIRYRSLEKRYNSIIDAVGMLSEQNELFRSEIETCYAKMENAQKNVDINKKIVMDSILLQNSMKDGFVKEITILKEKLKNVKEELEQ